MSSKRTYRHEKLARIYDSEILPIWSHRFGRMMLRGLTVPSKAMVLDVACGTGYPALEILRRLDEHSRLVAIDSSSAMLEVARRKLGDSGGKRLFFRTESAVPRLSFTDEVYDVVLCNLGLMEMPDPGAALRDFVRVAKTSGQVICTFPLTGTWGEFYDIYREVLIKHDKHEILQRFEAHLATYPRQDRIDAWAKQAGLAEVTLEVEEFSLLFKSSREFFFAPVVEHGPLVQWKAIAGKGPELQEVFWFIKEAIDAYFGERGFQVTVKAGCLRGIKAKGIVYPVAQPGTPAEAATDWVSVRTGNVEIIGERGAAEPEDPEDPEDDDELEAFKDEGPRAPK